MIKIRSIIGMFLLVIIILLAIVTIKYKDVLFSSKAQVKYPDGCVENYTNKNLTSPECTNGRMILEQSKKAYEKRFGLQPLIFNATT